MENKPENTDEVSEKCCAKIKWLTTRSNFCHNNLVREPEGSLPLDYNLSVLMFPSILG